MIKIPRQNINGFTIVEIMVAMTIFVTVIILGSNFIVTGFKGTTFVSEQETAVQNARKAMEIMTKEIRGANMSENGSYPLVTIQDSDFEYYSDINYDGEFEKVRYFLDETTNKLKKITTQPGPSNNYDTTPATTTIAEYINNDEEEIFKYYDSDYNETEDIDEIRLIKIILKVNVTPGIAPNDYYVETDVNLRNLKDNL